MAENNVIEKNKTFYLYLKNELKKRFKGFEDLLCNRGYTFDDMAKKLAITFYNVESGEKITYKDTFSLLTLYGNPITFGKELPSLSIADGPFSYTVAVPTSKPLWMVDRCFGNLSFGDFLIEKRNCYKYFSDGNKHNVTLSQFIQCNNDGDEAVKIMGCAFEDDKVIFIESDTCCFNDLTKIKFYIFEMHHIFLAGLSEDEILAYFVNGNSDEVFQSNRALISKRFDEIFKMLSSTGADFSPVEVEVQNIFSAFDDIVLELSKDKRAPIQGVNNWIDNVSKTNDVNIKKDDAVPVVSASIYPASEVVGNSSIMQAVKIIPITAKQLEALKDLVGEEIYNILNSSGDIEVLVTSSNQRIRK